MIDASMPPGPDHPGWRHAMRPCGTRFQIAVAGAPRCGVRPCTRDSIGVCEGDCGRRLCAEHGGHTGRLLCADCARGWQLAHERAIEAARVAQEQAAQRASAAAGRALAVCADPPAVRDVLLEHASAVKWADCKGAWLRLLASHKPAPTHEILILEGRKNPAAALLELDGRGRWSESAAPRVPAWRAVGTGRGGDPQPVNRDWHVKDAWLDVHGGLWGGDEMDSTVTGLSLGRHGKQRTCRIGLPKGDRVVVRRRSDHTGLLKWHTVVGASRLDGPIEHDGACVRALVAILNDVCAAG